MMDSTKHQPLHFEDDVSLAHTYLASDCPSSMQGEFGSRGNEAESVLQLPEGPESFGVDDTVWSDPPHGKWMPDSEAVEVVLQMAMRPQSCTLMRLQLSENWRGQAELRESSPSNYMPSSPLRHEITQRPISFGEKTVYTPDSAFSCAVRTPTSPTNASMTPDELASVLKRRATELVAHCSKKRRQEGLDSHSSALKDDFCLLQSFSSTSEKTRRSKNDITKVQPHEVHNSTLRKDQSSHSLMTFGRLDDNKAQSSFTRGCGASSESTSNLSSSASAYPSSSGEQCVV